MKKISASAMAAVKKMQQNECNESEIYQRIAKFAKGDVNKQTLNRLAREEYAHNKIWEQYTGIEMKPKKMKVFFYTLIARVLGFTFAVKLMERGEGNAQEEYALLAEEVPESMEIHQQEEEHEQALLQSVHSSAALPSPSSSHSCSWHSPCTLFTPCCTVSSPSSLLLWASVLASASPQALPT